MAAIPASDLVGFAEKLVPQAELVEVRRRGALTPVAEWVLDPIELDPARRRELFRRVFGNSLFFVLGFSVVFVAMGASATYIGQWFAANRLVLARIAGAVIIVLGRHRELESHLKAEGILKE